MLPVLATLCDGRVEGMRRAWDRVSLCSPDWPQTHCFFASASQVLDVCHHAYTRPDFQFWLASIWAWYHLIPKWLIFISEAVWDWNLLCGEITKHGLISVICIFSISGFSLDNLCLSRNLVISPKCWIY